MIKMINAEQMNRMGWDIALSALPAFSRDEQEKNRLPPLNALNLQLEYQVDAGHTPPSRQPSYNSR
jgi:hypothetical protein